MSSRLLAENFHGSWGGQAVGLFTLQHDSGMSVSICNAGAKVLQWRVPNAHGTFTDVCLGYDNLPSMRAGAPSMGAFIGRYAGRIGQSRYQLNARTHNLLANDGAHCLHGGPAGSRHQVFQVVAHDTQRLELRHRFKGEEDGHPGEVDLRLVYRWSLDGGLLIEHEATWVSGPASPASFAPHLFFNLDGEGTIDNHVLQLHAPTILLHGADRVVTGERWLCAGSNMDFRTGRALGSIPPLDHAFELGANPSVQAPRCVAHLSSPRSGRTMGVWTTEPVIQVYTADGLGKEVGKAGRLHRPRSAVCLEPQRYPNAVNIPRFPLTLVGPGQPYVAQTEYRMLS